MRQEIKTAPRSVRGAAERTHSGGDVFRHGCGMGPVSYTHLPCVAAFVFCIAGPGDRLERKERFALGRRLDHVWSAAVYLLTALAVLALAFVLYFIVHEALPTFQEVSLADFLLGQRWMPVDLSLIHIFRSFPIH